MVPNLYSRCGNFFSFLSSKGPSMGILQRRLFSFLQLVEMDGLCRCELELGRKLYQRGGHKFRQALYAVGL